MAWRARRWTRVEIVAPLVICAFLILAVWSVHTFLHVRPLLRGERGSSDYRRGVWQSCVLHPSTLLLLVCWYRSIFTDPGSVPDSDGWQMSLPEEAGAPQAAGGEPLLLHAHPPALLAEENGQVLEFKKSGDRRFCKWCAKYKPDRCHHCRVCQSCILRMDHHCPWIANCIGFHNHKYFLLLVAYSTLSSSTAFWTLGSSIEKAAGEECSQSFRFALIFARVVAFLMMSMLGVFLPWHLWLMSHGTTTIEFCEKRLKADAISYDRGILANTKAVLGDNVFLWLLPCGGPSGAGLFFETSGPHPRSVSNGGAAARSAQGGVLEAH